MEKNKDITREKIIKAASIAFSKYGFKKTTLDDISALTSISKTGIYYYFKNKEEVFQHVIQKEACKMQGFLQDVVNQETRPIDKMFAYVNGRMQFIKKLTSFYSSLKYNLFEHIEVINQNREKSESIEKGIIINILKEGDASGDFSIESVDKTAEMIYLILRGVEIPFFITNKKEEYEQKLERLISICMYGIIPRQL